MISIPIIKLVVAKNLCIKFHLINDIKINEEENTPNVFQMLTTFNFILEMADIMNVHPFQRKCIQFILKKYK